MPDVAIVVPTFRRPKSLRRLLDALSLLETHASVEVIVADNDAEDRQGIAVCRDMQPEYRWRLSAICVAERGIAQARNGLMEHFLASSTADFIAMLDDDETPAPGWLDALLDMQRKTGADAVRGAVLRVPENGTQALPGFARRAVSGPINTIDGAGNVLVHRRVFGDLASPYFDPAFALTGGEDRDFFTRLARAGATFACAADAVCYEHLPQSRTTLKWNLMRAYRIGNSDMRVFLKYRPSAVEKLGELAKIAGVMALCPVLALVFLPDGGRRHHALSKLFRAFGKSAALFGCYYHEYATVHGA